MCLLKYGIRVHVFLRAILFQMLRLESVGPSSFKGYYDKRKVAIYDRVKASENFNIRCAQKLQARNRFSVMVIF